MEKKQPKVLGKVKEGFIKGTIVTCLAGSVVAGGLTMKELSDLSDTRLQLEHVRDRAKFHEDHNMMVREQDDLVWQAFDNNLIDADKFTELMKANHSDDFAFENRYKLLDRESAMKWESLVEQERKDIVSMSASAIGTGVTLSVAALIGLHLYSKQKTREEVEGKSIEAEDELENN